MTEKNIVEFGLENVHYAPVTSMTPTGITYGSPVPLPGAVELSINPKGDLVEFEADNVTYYAAANNNGYEGELTMALIPDHFKEECLGEKKNATSNTMSEFANATSKGFALMYQFRGDKKNRRHTLYNCTANRPTVGGKTKGNGEPNTQKLTFVAKPRLHDNLVKKSTTEETPEETYKNWFTKPFEEQE